MKISDNDFKLLEKLSVLPESEKKHQGLVDTVMKEVRRIHRLGRSHFRESVMRIMIDSGTPKIPFHNEFDRIMSAQTTHLTLDQYKKLERLAEVTKKYPKSTAKQHAAISALMKQARLLCQSPGRFSYDTLIEAYASGLDRSPFCEAIHRISRDQDIRMPIELKKNYSEAFSKAYNDAKINPQVKSAGLELLIDEIYTEVMRAYEARDYFSEELEWKMVEQLDFKLFFHHIVLALIYPFRWE